MTTPISNKTLNHDEVLEATRLKRVATFQHMLCNVCLAQNAGQCIRENGECPVDTVGWAYRRAS